jgi:lipoate---protein ligase
MVCIDNPYTDAYFNLAAEEYLLEHFCGDVFMLWQNEASVIVGKNQNVAAEVNLDFAREHHIKVARRHTGGGAVYHDAGNLNLTFIETDDRPDFGKYTKRILAMLSAIGIEAQADERNSIYIDGLKISGCAQFIRKNKILFHASLLFSSDLSNLSATLNSSYTDTETKQYVKSVKSPVTNICDHLSEPLQLSDFKSMILNDFLGNAGNSMYAFSREDTSSINRLKKEKYVTNNWNFQALKTKHHVNI